jgi:hypothetical protein
VSEQDAFAGPDAGEPAPQLIPLNAIFATDFVQSVGQGKAVTA